MFEVCISEKKVKESITYDIVLKMLEKLPRAYELFKEQLEIDRLPDIDDKLYRFVRIDKSVIAYNKLGDMVEIVLSLGNESPDLLLQYIVSLIKEGRITSSPILSVYVSELFLSFKIIEALAQKLELARYDVVQIGDKYLRKSGNYMYIEGKNYSPRIVALVADNAGFIVRNSVLLGQVILAILIGRTDIKPAISREDVEWIAQQIVHTYLNRKPAAFAQNIN